MQVPAMQLWFAGAPVHKTRSVTEVYSEMQRFGVGRRKKINLAQFANLHQ